MGLTLGSGKEGEEKRPGRGYEGLVLGDIWGSGEHYKGITRLGNDLLRKVKEGYKRGRQGLVGRWWW